MPAKTAMIIDDDEDLGRLLIPMLEARKILTLPVYSLHEAEEYLSYMRPTIIFLDNSFPDGLGVDFIGSIKSKDKDIQIIMMTSDTSAWLRKKAMEEGAHYFLEKPFNKITIDQILDQVNLQHA